MPIFTPGVGKCGTKNPIWLNGKNSLHVSFTFNQCNYTFVIEIFLFYEQ